MRTYTSLHFHVIFGTRARVPCLHAQWRTDLFAYMAGTVRGLGAFPQGVGGWVDHVHLMFGMKAEQVLPDVIREVKKASSIWVKERSGVKSFTWQEGYGAFTVGYRERPIVKQYIADQEKHHQKITFMEEVVAFYEEAGVPYDFKYLV